MNKVLSFIIAALGFRFRPLIANAQRPGILATPQPPRTLIQPVPVLVRVPNGFPIPHRTNGASRRRKSNRLRISKMTRNKHR